MKKSDIIGTMDVDDQSLRTKIAEGSTLKLKRMIKYD